MASHTGYPDTLGQPLPDPVVAAVPVQLTEDIMLEIAYAAFRLHGGEEAKTVWQVNRPLAVRLQPAANTRTLIRRQNNLAGQAASVDRGKCFHTDLSQVGSLPGPLRASALAALGRSIVHLPAADQLQGFQGLLSALALLPERDRASTMALWPLPMLLNNLGFPASHALHDFLRDPANWRGAEDVITVGMAHLNFQKADLICKIADQLAQQTEPHALFNVLLQLASDPAFPYPGGLLMKLRCERVFSGQRPARLEWLHAAFSMMVARSETINDLGDGVVTELAAVADYQPIAEVVNALMEPYTGTGAGTPPFMITMLFSALLRLPVSNDRKIAWKALFAATRACPGNEDGQYRLLGLFAGDMCKTFAGDEFRQTFDMLTIHSLGRFSPQEIISLNNEVLHRAVEGMRELEDDVQRDAAFECLLDAIRAMDRIHLVSALEHFVSATSVHVPRMLKTLLDLVVGKELNLDYSAQAKILGSIDLDDRYDNFDAKCMENMLATWLTAIELLGGRELDSMLEHFISKIRKCPASTGMPTIVSRLEAMVVGLDRKDLPTSMGLSYLLLLCCHLPDQEDKYALLQRVLMAEERASGHLDYIGYSLKGILPATSASFEKRVVLAVFDALLKKGTGMTLFEKALELPDKLTDSDRIEIGATVLRNIELVTRENRYILLSAINAFIPGEMPAYLFQAWIGALSCAPVEIGGRCARLLPFAGRIGAQMDGLERDQAFSMLMSGAYAYGNLTIILQRKNRMHAQQAKFWFHAARSVRALKQGEQAGAFRFVLAAVNDPRCTATFEERWLVLRKLWRIAAKLPSHLQGGATAALKQALFERRLSSLPQQASQLHFESWDDLPHAEVQEATYSPIIRDWHMTYDRMVD